MVPQRYKVSTSHDKEILGWTILSRLLHTIGPHIGGTNVEVQSELATLSSKKLEQLDGFHNRIIRLQREINISVETVSTTRLLLQ